MEITQSYLDELIFTPKRITIKPERNYQVINGCKCQYKNVQF